MDRLSSVAPGAGRPVSMRAIGALVGLAAIGLAPALGCGDDKPHAPGARDRVNAVTAGAADRPDPAKMCDVFHAPGEAPPFHFPTLTAAAPSAGSGWRWVNVWATWCKPCVEELPRLAAWRGRLVKRGAAVTLQLISADESAAVVDSFRHSHPGAPPSLRLADPEQLPAWMEQLGVPGATLPVHVFVDPEGRVRCVRASAIEETDYRAVEALLGIE